MRWKKALLVDLVMNLASGLLGAVAIPLAGMLWEYFPGTLFYKAFHLGTFNPITWTATCLMAIFISSAVESVVVRYLFKFELDSKRFWAVVGANVLSTAIAFISLIRHPPQL
jgi:hypothetical protein